MTASELAHRRIRNQLLAAHPFGRPDEMVRWLCAVQAQDFRAALWAVGRRLPGSTEVEVENALAEGRIVFREPHSPYGPGCIR
jgi:hypothetical protein